MELTMSLSLLHTSMQDNVVDHIALVSGVVETEGAAKFFRRFLLDIVVVPCLHVHGEVVPETDKGEAFYYVRWRQV